MVKWLTVLACVAGALWGGWWFVGATAVERGALSAIEAARTGGWRIAYDDLSVAGFPNRFDTTVTDVDALGPDGWGLAAPFLQVFALSYRPNHVIAVAPPSLTVATPAGPVEVTNEDLRASAVLTASRTPTLRRATLVASEVTVSGRDGGIALGNGQLSTRQAGGPAAYDLSLRLGALRPDRFLLSLVDPAGTLPEAIRLVSVDATARLDRPLEAGAEPRIEALELRAAALRWGPVEADLAGDIAIGADGLPRGALMLELAGWEVLLKLAVEGGLIPRDRQPLIAAGLGGMARDGRIAARLELRDGMAFYGPLPLGPLPRLAVPRG
ncbi:DUF2125 domain-containing protein [Jannaschia ovalis]|uniref:DUF2125 domain-containing protein n=1 Tax=Jannaschia ovalis TaxID=3038773 RepID=A0ABY8LF75_9RHOB|nr:DUF2125 domain-containing protein [Jannaschia sp. GRR-S6-38]WGH79960.1 DUF2125 domain-containing protein [Jannaschia sp. GRR-S6-38]